MIPGLIKLLLTGLLLLNSIGVGAHGLKINTAQVNIRNDNHMIVRIRYDLMHFLHQLNQEKPLPLAFLANMSDQQLEQQFERIKAAFRDNLSIRLNNKPLQSMQFRFNSLPRFRAKIREQFMQQTRQQAMQKNGQNKQQKKSQTHSHDDQQQTFHMVNVDGFLPANHSNGNLAIDFPLELGEIMVTYSKPVSQTLKADANTIRYRQVIH